MCPLFGCSLLSRLSGCPQPKAIIPLWVAQLWGRAAAAAAALTGVPPQAPPDLLRTVAYGTLLFDSSTSDAELGLGQYRPIEESFKEAVEFIMLAQQRGTGTATQQPAVC